MKIVQATLLNPEIDKNGVSAVINMLNDSMELSEYGSEIIHPYKKSGKNSQKILDFTIRILQKLYSSHKNEIIFYFSIKFKIAKIASQIKKEVSVIHAHDPLTALFLSGKFKTKKVLLTHHYSNYPWVEYQKAGYVKENSFVSKVMKNKLLMGMTSESISHVFVSEARKNETELLAGKRIAGTIVYNSVQVPELPVVENRKSVTLVNIGRMEEAKNQIELINIVKELYNSGIMVRLEIIGDDNTEYANKVRRLVEEENLQTVVSLMGVMTHYETMKRLQNATYYIHTANTESFGISLLEAMSYRKPVFAYNYPALKEIIGEENYHLQCAEQGNSKKMTSLIVAAFNDINLSNKITDIQCERVNNLFTQEKMARNYLYIYSSLTKGIL